MRSIVRGLKASRTSVRDAPLYFRGVSLDTDVSYGDRSIRDYLDVMRNIHLITRRGGREKEGFVPHWELSPFGSTWAAIPQEENNLSRFEKAFVLRHLMMIDSHNYGLWFTLLLRVVEGTPKDFDEVVHRFRDRLEEYGCGIGGKAPHKVRPALMWMSYAGLIESGQDIFEVTGAGAEIGALHEDFFVHGTKAFGDRAAAAMAASIGASNGRVPSGSEIDIEEPIRVLHKGSRPVDWPVTVPQLRSYCCSYFLSKGIPMSDEIFDRRLLELGKTFYYKYELAKSSKVKHGYPYKGLSDGDNEYFYVDFLRT